MEDKPEINIKSEINILEKEMAATTADYSSQINELAEEFIEPSRLVLIKHKLYITRKNFVNKRFELQNRSALMNATLKREKRKSLVAVKTGKDYPKNFLDRNLILNNDYERETIYGNYHKEVELLIELLDNYIKFIQDSVNTIDKMIFGIPYVLELQKFKLDFNS